MILTDGAVFREKGVHFTWKFSDEKNSEDVHDE
jgi:hypothetical protein